MRIKFAAAAAVPYLPPASAELGFCSARVGVDAGGAVTASAAKCAHAVFDLEGTTLALSREHTRQQSGHNRVALKPHQTFVSATPTRPRVIVPTPAIRRQRIHTHTPSAGTRLAPH